MKIADRIKILDLPEVFANGPGVIHPVVLWDSNNVILVDTGLPVPPSRALADNFEESYDSIMFDPWLC